MQKLLFFDSTLRDGSHAVQNKLPIDGIAKYCRLANNSGLYTVIVGPGNGLGSSSLQVHLSLHSDDEMLSVARENLTQPKLGIYMIPGFATIKDNMIPAMKNGVELFCIGCHCTEADTTKQHIEFACKEGKEVYGVLMMYHMASLEELFVEAKKMQEYGVQGLILMDSSGASYPSLVKRTVSHLVDKLSIPIGFHGHNNLSMAVAHSFMAISEGATIIDGTIKAFGAGAGNCQLEALVALLEKEKIFTGLDINKLLDLSKFIGDSFSKNALGVDEVSVIGGISEACSAFTPNVLKAAQTFNVSAREIFMEVGRRKAVAGQEDIIVEVAQHLYNINLK